MVLKDLMKEANSVLKLDINWEDTNDQNYSQLLGCTRLRLNTIFGQWLEVDAVIEDAYKELVLFGIVAEYAFINGLYDMWKEYETKYNQVFTKVLKEEK